MSFPRAEPGFSCLQCCPKAALRLFCGWPMCCLCHMQVDGWDLLLLAVLPASVASHLGSVNGGLVLHRSEACGFTNYHAKD